ncbi:MAG: SAM hydrolase/SAM-dependent halogenase family protein [Bryobacteraceae bacterium]
MRRPIITLTTDFGASDHFVGVMKGVILTICPQAQIVDISHDVHPFEISEGAFLISQAFPWFPKSTIHTVVVDPGVGTARRPILLEASGQYFVAPDNGVLAMVYGKIKKHRVREVTAEKYFLQPVSRTFHGRDVFSPVAAHLASGVPPSRFGKTIEDYLKPAFGKPERTGKRVWTGTILKIDRFGNLITNFEAQELPDLMLTHFEMAVGIQSVSRMAKSYADGEGVFVIVGSSGFLEIAANQASAAKQLGCGVGAPVELTLY